ncbi:hypothetical protein BKA66DRAFT_424326 [Pyrenochaeta sp. MPI-SDFR-AT-0127]|nr:hypothetical protein BKA66DRAFT_424326 [Pyrenochaeta sp. MPI-SDFR-AT-0127]
MADTQRQAWPNRRIEILVPTTMLCGLSTIIQVWGLAYGFKIKRKLLLCDTLLVLAALLNITSTSICYETTHYGQGRHINDPSVSKSHDLTQYNYYLWIGQIINLIALTLLKYSICAYLLALKFSQVYLGVVWVSILMLTVLNFLMPIINMFCRDPLEANWNRDIGGKCFMKIGESRLAYTQAISNIITNVIYIVAPIIYLFTFQLPRQTQWGVCFICGLGFM